MKIAHILWGFTAGGIETMLVDIIAEQVKSADVAIFIVNDKEDPALISTLDSRCEVFCFHRKEGSKGIMPIIKLNTQLTTYNPDIIHYHYTSLVKLTFIHKPKVITIHNVHSSSNDFNRYDEIYAISDAVKDYIKNHGFMAITVKNGIKVKSIEKRVEPNSPHKPRFIQVGRLYHQHKGQHIMIEALNILVNLKGFKDFSMDFIGDGESKEYLEELVKNYNLTEYVNFLGNQTRDYIYSHLKDYDLCVQPSVSEGFGLTVAEAMAAKVPVVVSNIPGTMEVIDNGKYGYSFDTENAQSLADKIMAIIPQIGKLDYLDDAWNYVYEHFDISATARRYLEEYKKVIGK